MSTITFPKLDGEMEMDRLTDRLEAFGKDFNFLMSGNLSSQNAREFGGWQIRLDAIRSKTKDVGMSSSRASLENVRFWAGDVDLEAAPYRVYDTGRMIASNADITGKITATNGLIGGWTIEADKLSGTGTISGGTIEGSAIVGGTIDVETNVYIGDKLYLNQTSFTSDIMFNPYVYMYGEPAARVLRVVSPNGFYVNGTNIISWLNDLEDRVSALETSP